MKHFLLFYTTRPDYLERRGEFRGAHLEHAWQAHDRGELVLAGALADPADGAVFLFRGPGPGGAEAFAQGDPYVEHGLVAEWEVREWTTVVGDDAAAPVRPESA